MISGLQRPDRGSVHLDGTEVTRKGTHRRARLGLARTFQRLELFSTLSATDNVRVGLEAGGKADGDDRGGAARAGRRGRRGHAQVSSLPTGSARLVELARALSTDPKVLLLDEPCSGLDEHESEALGRLFTSLAAEGRAVVIVEHDTDLVLRGLRHRARARLRPGHRHAARPTRSATTRRCRRPTWVTRNGRRGGEADPTGP